MRKVTWPFAVTAEAKALMEQILASNGSKEEIASRVEALLAGSELSSSRGVNGGIDGSKQHFSFSCSLWCWRGSDGYAMISF